MKVAAELSEAMLGFAEALNKWLNAGGDKRLMEFTPLDSWAAVVELMAKDGNDFVCHCPVCQAKRLHH